MVTPPAYDVALESELRDARTLLLKRFEGITLASLAKDFERRAKQAKRVRSHCP